MLEKIQLLFEHRQSITTVSLAKLDEIADQVSFQFMIFNTEEPIVFGKQCHLVSPKPN